VGIDGVNENIYYYSFGCTFISRIRELEKRRDALRAEPTNKAGAEPNSFELCPARRRKTKSNLRKSFEKSEMMPGAS